MKWTKKANIYTIPEGVDWMLSHAQCPTALVLLDTIRIFFSVRDHLGESLITYIDVDKDDPSHILYQHNVPILPKGKRGTFDENGLIPSYIIEIDKKIFLYYAGWSRSVNVPYKNFTGLAISEDGGSTFKKFSDSPVLTMDHNNPLSATGPCIIRKDDQFECIYSTGIDWIDVDGKYEHTYLLVSAHSKDGINWETSQNYVIKPEKEYMAHCKPAVAIINGKYHLWFSKRGSYNFREAGDSSYRLGYAVSNDFKTWNRHDEICGIDVSPIGWDSEMICYPHIIQMDKKIIMFYNGNGFGKSGFGYAVLENEVN